MCIKILNIYTDIYFYYFYSDLCFLWMLFCNYDIFINIYYRCCNMDLLWDYIIYLFIFYSNYICNKYINIFK